MQLYAQFESLPRGAIVQETSEDGEEDLASVWYESWTCNMKYFTDLTEKSKDDTIETIFYEGSKLISGQQGTFSSSNNE